MPAYSFSPGTPSFTGVPPAVRITAYTFGPALVLTGALGIFLLLMATANPLGVSAFAAVYWPGTVVVLILTLFGIGMIEGGLAVMRSGAVSERAPERRVTAFVGVVTVVVILGLAGLGLSWAWSQSQTSLGPTAETYVVGGTFALYAVLRVVLTMSGARGGELANAVGIEPAVADAGETQGRFALRVLFGFLVGIPMFDSLIVLVGVALAPGDKRIYPTPSDTTLVAALLWLVGLAAASSGIAAFLRSRAGPRKLLVHALVAVTALVPAFALDARVPLYPFIAGVFGQASR